MLGYLIATGAIIGTITVAFAAWSWRAGHSTEMWQQYRMTDGE